MTGFAKIDHFVKIWLFRLGGGGGGGETATRGSKQHGSLWGLWAKEQNRRIEL